MNQRTKYVITTLLFVLIVIMLYIIFFSEKCFKDMAYIKCGTDNQGEAIVCGHGFENCK